MVLQRTSQKASSPDPSLQQGPSQHEGSTAAGFPDLLWRKALSYTYDRKDYSMAGEISRTYQGSTMTRNTTTEQAIPSTYEKGKPKTDLEEAQGITVNGTTVRAKLQLLRLDLQWAVRLLAPAEKAEASNITLPGNNGWTFWIPPHASKPEMFSKLIYDLVLAKASLPAQDFSEFFDSMHDQFSLDQKQIDWARVMWTYIESQKVLPYV